MANSEHVNECGASNKICKSCNKKVVNSQKCKKCDAKYHPSCAQKIKQCCGLEINENENNITNLKVTEEMFLCEENKLLRQIIADKDVIINDKEVIIKLLKSQITLLEEKLAHVNITAEVTNNCNNINKLTTKTFETETKEFSTKKNCVNKSTEKSLVQGDLSQRIGASEKDFSISLQQKQLDIMTNVIDLNKNIEILQRDNFNDNRENEKTVLHKNRRKNKKINIGDAEIDSENELDCFVGRTREKRIWLFLSNVKDHVTEEMILNFLKNKTREELIFVKEIVTFRKRKDNKCFKVGISYEQKDEAYTSSFWPKGVTVYRFNFKREERTLNRLQIEKTAPNTSDFLQTSRPQNFQDLKSPKRLP